MWLWAVFIVVINGVNVAQGGCGNGWTDTGTYCYKVERGPYTSVEDARDACLTQGGDLASFDDRSTEIQAYSSTIRSMTSKPEALFVSLNDVITEGQFEWSDGGTSSYVWEAGEPSVSDADSMDCVMAFSQVNWDFGDTGFISRPCCGTRADKNYDTGALCQAANPHVGSPALPATGPLKDICNAPGPVTCRDLPGVNNITVTTPNTAVNYTEGDVVTFSCIDLSHVFNGTSLNTVNLKCDEDGNWTSNATELWAPFTCAGAPAPSTGPTGYAPHTSTSPPFTMRSVTTDSSTPVINQHTCPEPGVVDLTTQDGEGRGLGEVVVYRCISGARFRDGDVSKSIVCGHYGWSSLPTACQEIKCPDIVARIGSRMNSTVSTPGSVVMIWCDEGYSFDDEAEYKLSICTNKTRWQPTPEACSAAVSSTTQAPVEAAHAEVVGTIAIVFMSIELALVVLLDAKILCLGIRKCKRNVQWRWKRHHQIATG